MEILMIVGGFWCRKTKPISISPQHCWGVEKTKPISRYTQLKRAGKREKLFAITAKNLMKGKICTNKHIQFKPYIPLL